MKLSLNNILIGSLCLLILGCNRDEENSSSTTMGNGAPTESEAAGVSQENTELFLTPKPGCVFTHIGTYTCPKPPKSQTPTSVDGEISYIPRHINDEPCSLRCNYFFAGNTQAPTNLCQGNASDGKPKGELVWNDKNTCPEKWWGYKSFTAQNLGDNRCRLTLNGSTYDVKRDDTQNLVVACWNFYTAGGGLDAYLPIPYLAQFETLEDRLNLYYSCQRCGAPSVPPTGASTGPMPPMNPPPMPAPTYSPMAVPTYPPMPVPT